jgi:hypothetical protein
VLNSNHRGTGRGKTAGDLGERVPRVPRGIPMRNSDQHNLNAGKNLVLQNSTLVFICMFIEPKKETNKKTMTCCFHNLNADNNLVLNTKFNACSYLYVY